MSKFAIEDKILIKKVKAEKYLGFFSFVRVFWEGLESFEQGFLLILEADFRLIGVVLTRRCA